MKSYIKIILLAVLWTFSWTAIIGQNLNKIKVYPEDNDLQLKTLINKLEKEHDIDIVLEKEQILNDKVFNVIEATTIKEYFNQVYPLYSMELFKEGVLAIYDGSVQPKSELVFVLTRIKKGQFLSRVLNGENEKEDDVIYGANLYFPAQKKGCISDANGILRYPAKGGILRAQLSYVGYLKQDLVYVISHKANNQLVSIPLFFDLEQFGVVTVYAQKSDANVRNKMSSIEKLKIEAIRELPTFLGEVDPIKSVTTLPGVTSNGDISSGFNVRGGENSQNLILYDGTMIFNPTHLFGFFSAFNPDFIQDLVLLKGGGPARYGGRVASVLDIKSRNGNLSKTHVNGGLGFVSSRLSVEGPIVKNKASYLIGGRYSYGDWFIHQYEDVRLKKSFSNFNDISAKVYTQLSQNNFISASFYKSYDDFNIGIDSTYNWGTLNYSLKWDHLINEKSNSSLQYASSHYNSGLEYEDEIFGYVYDNDIQVHSLRYRYNSTLNKRLKLGAGVSSHYYILNPGNSIPSSDNSNSEEIQLNEQYALDNSLFFDLDIDITDRLSLTSGLRYSHYFRLGPDQSYSLDYNTIEGRLPAIGPLQEFKSGEIISQNGGLEPRFSLRYILSKSFSVKAGYNRMKQYIHQVSPTTSPSPVDFWIASSPNIKPLSGDQFTLGFFKNFLDNSYESSIEGFYKNIYNTVDYIAGSTLNLNPFMEAGLLQGKGVAYGIEALFKKKQGRVNGFVAYTYSRSLRQFENVSAKLNINEGAYYPSVFDKPHQLSMVLNFSLSRRFILTSNFTYNSGIPITIPVSKYSYDKILSINNYSFRNEYRGPDYHRLDLSLKMKTWKIPGKNISGEWIISVFNIYGRKNAYAIFFNRNGQAYKTSILGSAIPSISYNFKFD